MINIKWSLLCRAVEKSPDGVGNNLLGVIEDYRAERVPYQIDQMVVVLNAEITDGLYGAIELKIIRNTRTLWRTGKRFENFPIEDKNQIVQTRLIVINLGEIILPEFGDYSVTTSVNDQIIHISSFRLLQRTAPINAN